MADLVVGATVTVSGGKYDGRTGRVTSVAEKSCKLSIDDAETISITKAQLAVAIGSVLGAAAAAADAADAAADAAAGTEGPGTSEDPLAVGAMVTVTGGKYDGRTGRVTSVADKSCKLSIDDAETGSIKKSQLVAATSQAPASTPPRRQDRASPPESKESPDVETAAAEKKAPRKAKPASTRTTKGDTPVASLDGAFAAAEVRMPAHGSEDGDVILKKPKAFPDIALWGDEEDQMPSLFHVKQGWLNNCYLYVELVPSVAF
jgi:ribosomal protein L24